MADIALRSTQLVDGYGAGYVPVGSPTSPRYTVTKSIVDNNNATATITLTVTIRTNNGYVGGGYTLTLNFSCAGVLATPKVWKASAGIWNQNSTYSTTIAVTIPLDGITTKTADLWLTINSGTYFTFRSSTQGGDQITGIPVGYRVSTFNSFSNFNSNASTVGVSVTRNTASLTNRMTMKIGSTVIDTWSNLGTFTSLTLSAAATTKIHNALPSSSSATVTMVMETLNGSTVIGSASKTATVTIPTTIAPSASGVTISEQNTAVQNLLGTGKYAQLLSKLQISITGAKAGEGASISAQRITFNGVNYASGTATVSSINASGTLPIAITVTDSRGRSYTSSASSVTLIPYAVPVMSGVMVRRASNTSGALSDEGVYLRVDRNASVSPLTVGTMKNSLQLRIWTKTVTSGSWTEVYNNTWASASISGQTVIASPTYPVTTSYDVRVMVSDKFNSTESHFVLPTAKYPMILGVDNVGIGKVPQEGIALDVGGNSNIDGNLSISNLILPSRQIIDKGGKAYRSVSGIGWKRIATFKMTDANGADGVGGLLCNIRLNRFYNNTNNEAWDITLAQAYRQGTFSINGMQQNGAMFTAIRYLVDLTAFEGHLDVYYNSTVANESFAYITYETPTSLISFEAKNFVDVVYNSAHVERAKLEFIDSGTQVLESTSGGTARCLRLPNGWQEISWKRSLSTTINLVSGGMFYSANSIAATAWPWVFSEAPTVSVQSHGNGQYTWCGMPWSPSATTCPAIALYKGSADGTTRSYGIDITARGRWK